MQKLIFILAITLAISQICWLTSCSSSEDPTPQEQPTINNDTQDSSTNDDEINGASHNRTQDNQEPPKLEYSLNTNVPIVEINSSYIMTINSNQTCNIQVYSGADIIAAKKDTKVLTVILPTSNAGQYSITAVATAGNIKSNTISHSYTVEAPKDEVSYDCTLLNKAKLQATVPYTEATKLVFDLKKNVNTSSLTATGIYVDDEENNLQVYRRGTEYYVLSECNGEVMAPKNCGNLFAGSVYHPTAFKDIIFNSFNTQNVTDMSYMFYCCESLSSLDLSKFNTSNVTNMCGMFRGCASLTSLDVTNFDTRNITDMFNMFASCASLTSLDATNFDTRNVTDMAAMFSECSSLQTIKVSQNFKYEQANVVDMLYDCSATGNYGPNSQLTLIKDASSIEKPSQGNSY